MHSSEVQNFAFSDNNDSLEIIHHKFCKFALGVSMNATNLEIYDELRCTPLSICRKVEAVKYWHRLTSENEEFLSI